jgi:hypothetical protein
MLAYAKATQDYETESDGTVVSFAYAQDYIDRKVSTVVPERHHTDANGVVAEGSDFYRITDPDIHSVNWITADELEKAVDATEKVGGYFFAGYRAVIAAMRALEASGFVSMVRFVYGFDN